MIQKNHIVFLFMLMLYNPLNAQLKWDKIPFPGGSRFANFVYYYQNGNNTERLSFSDGVWASHNGQRDKKIDNDLNIQNPFNYCFRDSSKRRLLTWKLSDSIREVSIEMDSAGLFLKKTWSRPFPFEDYINGVTSNETGIYVYNRRNELYATYDNAQTWQKINWPIHEDTLYRYYHSSYEPPFVDKSSSLHTFLKIDNYLSDTLFYLYKPLNKPWEKKIVAINKKYSSEGFSFTVSPNQQVFFMAKTTNGNTFLRSDDYGNSWQIDSIGVENTTLPKLDSYYSSVTMLFENQYLYVLPYIRTRIYRRSLKESVWEEIPRYLGNNTSDNPNSIYYITESNKNLSIATNEGIFKSNDKGKTWVEENTFYNLLSINSLIRLSNGRTIVTTEGSQVFYKDKNDIEWRPSIGKFAKGGKLAYHPNSKTIRLFKNDVYFSNDNGESWQLDTTFPKVTKSFSNHFVDKNGDYYLRNYNNLYVKKGDIWVLDTIGLFQNDYPLYNRNSLISDGQDYKYIAWPFQRKYKNEKWMWDTVGIPPNKSTGRVYGNQKGEIYAKIDTAGDNYSLEYSYLLFKRGMNKWEKINVPLSIAPYSNSVYGTISVDSNNIVFLPFYNFDPLNQKFVHKSIFSTDKGVNWREIDPILGNTSGVFYSFDNYTYFINEDGYIYITETKAVPTPTSELSNNSFKTLVYPNPAHGFVQFELDMPSSSKVDLHIFNILGNIVLSKSEKLDSGKQILTLNTEGVASGIYFYQLTLGTQKAMGTFVVQR